MSGLLHEDRLANTLASGQIGLRETVEVRTKMGQLVATGEVVSSTPWGIVVQEGAAQNFYADRLYLFSVLEPELEEVIGNVLADTSPDSRVEAKLAQMEAGEPQPGAVGAKSGSQLVPDDDKGDDKGDDEKGDEGGEEDDKKGKGDDEGPIAKPGSAIDPEKLPEDIKKSILSAKQMDEEQLNGVLSEISDAAMKSLKRTGVKETEIFGLVNKIQHSVYRILTGEPAPPPAPKKKESKK